MNIELYKKCIKYSVIFQDIIYSYLWNIDTYSMTYYERPPGQASLLPNSISKSSGRRHCVEKISKGKFFDIQVKNNKDYIKEIEKISVELLSNPIIENFKIVKK